MTDNLCGEGTKWDEAQAPLMKRLVKELIYGMVSLTESTKNSNIKI
jgi:hypothetical protein